MTTVRKLILLLLLSAGLHARSRPSSKASSRFKACMTFIVVIMLPQVAASDVESVSLSSQTSIVEVGAASGSVSFVLNVAAEGNTMQLTPK